MLIKMKLFVIFILLYEYNKFKSKMETKLLTLEHPAPIDLSFGGNDHRPFISRFGDLIPYSIPASVVDIYTRLFPHLYYVEVVIHKKKKKLSCRQKRRQDRKDRR